MPNYKEILGFNPNQEQKQVLKQIEKFISSNNDVFILKGSAGTGKTSVVKAITNKLVKDNINFYLNAPTGRASAIIGEKTGQKSRTIHSRIYTPQKTEDGFTIKLIRKINTEKVVSVYLVDESSMINSTLVQDSTFLVSKPLLADFIDFVKQGNKKNKIIFIGDRFQLPPVYENFSSVLNPDYLTKHFNLKCTSFELSKVMRQEEGSDILDIAVLIKNSIKQGYADMNIPIRREKYPTFAMRKYMSFFNNNKPDNTIAICSTNRDVNYWNNWVRRELGIASTYISEGDFIINQTTWMNKSGNWVQKGEFGKIILISTEFETFADLTFTDAIIEFQTSSDTKKQVKAKILLNSLNTNYGILDEEQEKKLYADVMKYNAKFRQSKDVADDKFLGAMRLRHGYAVTCYKAQGGEWDNVLIHPWKMGNNLQWAYTAVTRARKNVFSYVA